MKKLFYLFIIALLLTGCNDSIDIKQDYDFSIQMLPIPKKLAIGESTPIEFSIIRDKIYKGAKYSFRFFQSDGDGVLTDDAGNPYTVNRYYSLENDSFKMLYRSECEEAQTLDFVFLDNLGNELEYSISFQHNPKKK